MAFICALGLAGIAALFAWRLSRKARFTGHLCVWLWAGAFLSVGSAALLGAFHSLIAMLLPNASGEMLLRFSLALWLLAHALLLTGALLAYCAGRALWIGLLAVALKLGVFLVYMGHDPRLAAVLFDGVLTSMTLLALCTYGAWTWKYPHGQWIVAGAVLWLFAALLFQGKVGLGTTLAPEGVFFSAFIVVLSLMVRGGWHLRDRTEAPNRLALRRVGWRT